MAKAEDTTVSSLTGDEKWHGTPYGYSKKGCRCDRCREAKTEQQREWKKNRATKDIPEHVHGTANGYGNYGCRCELCKQAWADDARNRYRGYSPLDD